jgi:hypothetical protein
MPEARYVPGCATPDCPGVVFCLAGAPPVCGHCGRVQTRAQLRLYDVTDGTRRLITGIERLALGFPPQDPYAP